MLIRAAGIAASVMLVVVAVIVAAPRIGGSGKSSPPASVPAPASPPASSRSDTLPNKLPTVLSALASGLNRAQEIIDDTSSTRPEIASAGRFEQLATFELGAATRRVRGATLAMLGKQEAASMRVNLDATAALSRLAAPHRGLPHWKIVQPPAPSALLGYFRAGQSRFGVPWEVLAAIEFIETSFGRVGGISSAGAQGPMQFMPATWARYGSGHIDNQRDAILSAARYLVANGAPGNMLDALYHYNNSRDYVRAVEDYASRIGADNRVYFAYYYWHVLYTHINGTVILPVGYPKVRPVPFNSRDER